MIFFPSPVTRFLALNGTVFVILLISKEQFLGTSLKFKGRRGLPVDVYLFQGNWKTLSALSTTLDLNGSRPVEFY